MEKLPPDVPGAVMVRIIVGTDGKIRKATAYAGAALLLDRAAEALAKWEFVPQTLNGEPVEVQSMAVIEVCKQTEQPQVEASLHELKRLTGECSDEANDDAEMSCVEAMTLADGMSGEIAMLGRWWAYAAYGNLRARQGKPKEADEIFTRALAWFREQPLSGAMQLDFLWQLAGLREGLREYERALQPYRDAEALVQTAMDQIEGANFPESTYQEIHAAQVRNMKRALEGEIRCLIALERDSEADALRIKVAQLK
ncbi:MAG TPA: energy transducer TonB [Terriglobales bacterium]|nr:energy transducer TonB [Terriglobales bacterium]